MSAVCLHCEAQVREPLEWQVYAGDKHHPVCCEACQTAAQTILDKGLQDFYRFRDAPDGVHQSADPDLARWSSYDREQLQSEFVTRHTDGTRTANLLLQGVRCAACSWLVERGIAVLDGVESISVNAVTTRTDVHWDPARIELSQILSQIALLGFMPYPHTDDEAEAAGIRERQQSLKRLIVAGLGMMQVTTFAVALYAGALQGMEAQFENFFRLVSLLVATPIVFYAGAPFFQRAWHDLKLRAPGMDVPVALAIGGAYTASVWNTFIGSGEVYFDSATMFVFFLTAARHLEMTGRHRVLGLSDAYARHIPRVATRLEAGRPREVAIVELTPGDTVLVNPGQTFPADGILTGNDVSVDEALLTGESEPVLKQPGDRVVAGAVNQRKAAEFRVEQFGANTELAQIGQLMARAQTEKPPIVQLANKVASRFVLAVLCAAAIVGIVWWVIEPERAFGIVLAVLVVTCPCALALATPAAFTVASSALARRGFLIRRAGALEELQRVSDWLFDKTGTLTERSLTLKRIELFAGVDEPSVLDIAAALEARSEHPIAQAFVGRETALTVMHAESVPGAGLAGEIGGVRYHIGTPEFVAELCGNEKAQRLSINPGRNVFLADSTRVLARFELAEAPRAGAAETIAALAARGLNPMIASGDRAITVSEFADRLQVPVFHAGLTPADKLALVRDLQNRGAVVAMVGDGINDSPVLAGANLSIAMGSGTSLAQHSADCVMLNEDLRTLVTAYDMARRTMQVVRQNLAWALGYNLIALPLAATGFLAPWMAALGMSASSLLVTGNALRLSRFGARSESSVAAVDPIPAATQTVPAS
jgi:Cu2+-exporting ATPase